MYCYALGQGVPSQVARSIIVMIRIALIFIPHNIAIFHDRQDKLQVIEL